MKKPDDVARFEAEVARELDTMERAKRTVCPHGCFAVEGEQAIYPVKGCPMHDIGEER